MTHPLNTPEIKTSESNKSWKIHIEAYNQSGLNGSEYCRQQHLSYHAFRYWHKKLVGRTSEKITFVPVTSVKIPKGNNSSWQTSMKVEVGNRFKIELPENFAPGSLIRLIALLEGC